MELPRLLCGGTDHKGRFYNDSMLSDRMIALVKGNESSSAAAAAELMLVCWLAEEQRGPTNSKKLTDLIDRSAVNLTKKPFFYTDVTLR